jgi:DNA polymerase I-like protein with 3'-5' exonuclease and polymerase domains
MLGGRNNYPFTGRLPIVYCNVCNRYRSVRKVHVPSHARDNMGLAEDLRARGVYEGYERYVLGLEPILTDLHTNGMPVDTARYVEVHAELSERKIDAEKAMQALIPDEVRLHHPKLGYKKEPKDFVDGGPTTHNGEPATWAYRDFIVNNDPTVRESRPVKLAAWKPSHDGLVRYMMFKRHPIPHEHKTLKTTTSEAELVRLAHKTKDFLYDAVLTYRQICTILNNHMKNWAPHENRVHPHFYYDTGTGQLSSRRPNAQNAPKHGQAEKKELADMFRSMIIAKEGHTLVEFDYKSFHAQTLAFEAEDKDYLRLAKLDIHSYLTAHLVRHPNRDSLLGQPDQELADALRQIKREHRFVRDYKAKRAVLGYGFGMGYRKLYSMYQEAFDNEADAKRVVDTLNALFPRANAWRDEIRRLAHDQGYLISRFGCIRYFWEVYKWAGRWIPGGNDSEAAIAFLPANDAFCHIKEAMRTLHPRWGRYLINQIHDALMYELPDAEVPDAIASIRATMESPSPILNNSVAPAGLAVEVGVSLGKSWDKMEDYAPQPPQVSG